METRWLATNVTAQVTFLLFALGCARVWAQDPPAKTQTGFRIAVNLVLVNVSVTDPNGKRQADLSAGDFELFEDDVRQDVRFFHSAEAPFHVALIVDTSGSTASKLDLIRKAADRFLGKLTPEDRVAVIDVAGRVQVLQSFTENRRVLSRQLRRIGTTRENGTLLRDALVHVLESLFRGIQGRKAIVFLTDAQDSGSKTPLAQLTEAVHLSDAVLYGLLVDTQEDLLKTMRAAEARFSRIALVLEASSSSRVDEVKQAGQFLLDLLPATVQVGLVEHRSARRATLLVPHTLDRDQLKDGIAKATVLARTTEMPSSWKASGTTVLLTDSSLDLPQRIQSDILDESIAYVLGKKPAGEWQKDLRDLCASIPDPSQLRKAIATLPEEYPGARQRIMALCDHSGGRSFDFRAISELDGFYEQVAEELRRTYSLGYYSQAAPGRYHFLEVKLTGARQANLRSRRGFLLPTGKD